MLTVDFINSLGITAEKITVENNGQTIFNANAATGHVELASTAITGTLTADVIDIKDSSDHIIFYANKNDKKVFLGGDEPITMNTGET